MSHGSWIVFWGGGQWIHFFCSLFCWNSFVQMPPLQWHITLSFTLLMEIDKSWFVVKFVSRTVIVHSDVGSEPSENGEKDDYATKPTDTEVLRQFYDYMVNLKISQWYKQSSFKIKYIEALITWWITIHYFQEVMSPLSEPEEQAMTVTTIDEKWKLICNQVWIKEHPCLTSSSCQFFFQFLIFKTTYNAHCSFSLNNKKKIITDVNAWYWFNHIFGKKRLILKSKI